MKTMKFRSFKADMILAGAKTSSLRLFDDKSFAAGDEFELVRWETGEVFAHAVITHIIEKPISEIQEEDLLGHEPFPENDMLGSLKQYYPEATPNTMGKIVQFRLLGKE